jgi:hypothetical protein
MGAIGSSRRFHPAAQPSAARTVAPPSPGYPLSASAATPVAVMPGNKIVKGPPVSSWWPEVSGWSGCGLEHFDGALGPGCFGEFPVAGEQGGVHGFGEGYVGRVVDGEVVP